MSDFMKYNAILPRDADDYYLWYDSLKGWRLNIRGVGNHPFNAEAEILFEIESDRIIKLLESFDPRIAIGDILPLLIKGENK